MQYNIPAKPTMYNGRLFRSRLEAKWQCMFDKLGWQAEYEPCQINGWNPDFIIKCSSPSYPTNSIIVEIKPSVMIDNYLVNDVFLKYETCKAHILLLSDFPFLIKNYTIELGIGSQFYGIDKNIESTQLPRSDMHELQMKCFNDFSSENMMWDGMVSGIIERKNFISFRSYEYHYLLQMWGACGNEIQFNIL